MSHTKNQVIKTWKAVLSHIGRVSSTWKGQPLSAVDNATYHEAILMAGIILHDLSNRYVGCGNHRDHITWVTRAVTVDVAEMAAFLSDAISDWRRVSISADKCEYRTYADFKRQLKKKHPFAGDFLSPISGAIDLHLRAHTSATFRPVYQFLSFLNHLTLTNLGEMPELEEEYMEQEQKLVSPRLPYFINDLNEIMVRWMHDWSVSSDAFEPCHGPGAVAELTGDRSKESKYRVLCSDQILDYVFRKFGGIDPHTCYVPQTDVPTSRVSRVIFVPKSMKTRRTISAEPATLMYFQQGVQKAVREHMSHNPYLRSRIDFTSQSTQQEVARCASEDGTLATIDLSAASDSISLALVKGVFARTPLLPFLLALRSRHAILPSGRKVELHKYAPMGSALTFPIQTILFACVCESTARYMHSTSGITDFRWRVYGDDIIVPTTHSEELVYRLSACGFAVNTAKSFSEPYRFRESCGMDAYNGVCVTPLRIGRRFSARRVTHSTPGLFEAHIDMANSAYQYGFTTLRSYIIDKLINECHMLPVFSDTCDYGLYSPTPNNHKSPRRWRYDYQREEIKVTMAQGRVLLDNAGRYGDTPIWPVAPGHSIASCDDIRYLECLRSTRNRTGCSLEPSHLVEAKIGSSVTRLTERWVGNPT